jgi:hypothetical protein
MLTTITFYAITIIYFLLTFWIAYRRWKKVKTEQGGIPRQIIYWFVYILLTSILYVILLIIIFWTFVLATHDSREKSFNTEKWKKEPKIRVLMIDDLMKRKILENKSKSEVLNLLGKPESNDSTYDSFINDLYRSESLNHKTDIIYKLGARNGVLQPMRHLEIWFKNDTVLRYENR